VSIDRLGGRLGCGRRPERAVVTPRSIAVVVQVPPASTHYRITLSPGGTFDSAGVVIGSPHSPH